MLESTAPAPAETATAPSPQTQAPASTPQETPQAQPPSQAPAPRSGLDFIPDAYKEASWAKKYQNPEELWKGVDHMAKTMGQKQIINGIIPPSEEAPDEEWDKFYNLIGKPDSSDKYTLPDDVEIPEGYDIDTVKTNLRDLAHKTGLNQKQTAKLYKEFMALEKQNFVKTTEAEVQNFDVVIKQTFPESPEQSLAMAKRGAKSLGIADTLDQEGLSLNPTVLKLCAKLGEFVGEDSFVKTNSPDSKEAPLEKAKRLQSTEAYWNDQKIFDEVAALYQQAQKK